MYFVIAIIFFPVDFVFPFCDVYRGATCGRQVYHFQVEMANSEGGAGLWHDDWEHRLQEAQDRPVYLTLDVSQRLQIGGGNEVWLGLFLVLNLGHVSLIFGFGLAERISELTAELLGGHSSVGKHLL